MTGPASVRLREMQPADIAIFFEQQADPLATEMAAFPARDRQAHDSHWLRITADPAVTIRTIDVDDGAFGHAVAGNVVAFGTPEEREIGYWLGRPWWGRGIATAAVRAFLAIETHRPLRAYVATHNRASIRVLEKAGFVATGRVGEHLVLTLDGHEPGADPPG